MPRRKRSKKWLYWVLILALIVVAGVIVYFVWDGYFRDRSGEAPRAAESTSATTSDTVEKKESEKKVSEQPVSVEEKKVVQYEGEDPNKSATLTGAITYAEVSGNYLMIRVNIDQYLAGGTCTLGIRQGGGSVYGDTANIVDSAATSTCEGFNVPLSELPGGHYNLVIYLVSGEKTGEIHGEVDV